MRLGFGNLLGYLTSIEAFFLGDSKYINYSFSLDIATGESISGFLSLFANPFFRVCLLSKLFCTFAAEILNAE
jgi:hypothetical protein